MQNFSDIHIQLELVREDLKNEQQSIFKVLQVSEEGEPLDAVEVLDYLLVLNTQLLTLTEVLRHIVPRSP